MVNGKKADIANLFLHVGTIFTSVEFAANIPVPPVPGIQVLHS